MTKTTKMTPRSVPKRLKILPRRLQDGLEEVFFSHRFLSSILVRFGSVLGSIWVSFGSPFAVLGVRTPWEPLASPRDPLASLWYLWGSHLASLGALWPLFGTLGGCLEAQRGQKVYENQERSCRTGRKGERTELD